MIDEAWLERANAADLEALATSIAEGRIAAPFTAGAVQLAGFHRSAATFLAGLGAAGPEAIAWMLRRLAAERRRADDRLARAAQLVWTGPSDGAQNLRDTKVVLDALFGQAERHVLISTLVLWDGRAVFAKLAERLRARPDITVELFVNVEGETGTEEGDVERFVESFRRWHWFDDLPWPAIYYDPDSRKPRGAESMVLHAKCVVVDERLAFVTSANFTDAAQTRNIEAGVLLDHPRLAEALAGRFRALRETGAVRRMR